MFDQIQIMIQFKTWPFSDDD